MSVFFADIYADNISHCGVCFIAIIFPKAFIIMYKLKLFILKSLNNIQFAIRCDIIRILKYSGIKQFPKIFIIDKSCISWTLWCCYIKSKWKKPLLSSILDKRRFKQLKASLESKMSIFLVYVRYIIPIA